MSQKKVFLGFAIGLLVFLSFDVLAESISQDVTFGSPRLIGNGCRRRSFSVSKADDKTSISILFDKFGAEVGTPSNQDFLIRRCRILLPVSVPPGVTAAYAISDFRGFADVPVGGYGTLITDYSVYSYLSQKTWNSLAVKHFRGPAAETVQQTRNLPLYSTCLGGQFRILLDVQLSASTNVDRDTTSVTLDSFDGQTARFDVYTSPCVQ